MEDVPNFDSIVLSGAGSKGICHIGALQYFYERGLFQPKNIKEYVGTSIGSVICLLLICGYTPMSLFVEVYKFSFLDVQVEHANIWNIVKYMGLVDISNFLHKIQFLVELKFGKCPTMKELWDLTAIKLSIISSNITKMREEVYSVDTVPNMSCMEAIKRSCLIPGFFYKITDDNCTFVDGGLMNNFPINHVSDNCKNTLGIIIKGNRNLFTDDQFLGYFMKIITAPIDILTRFRCMDIRRGTTLVTIDVHDVSTINFILTEEEKMSMFLNGYNEAKQTSKIKRLLINNWPNSK